MKRNINNPYDRIKEHNCFACSSHNKFGLKMNFYQEDNMIICEWEPRDEYQGYHNVLHGGVQATLMDEISSWCIQIKLKTAGVTSRLETKYKHPVYTNTGKIKLTAQLKETYKNIATVKVRLYDSSAKLCSESLAKYVIFPRELANEKFYYPDYESFFSET